MPVDLTRLAVDAEPTWSGRCAAVGVPFRVETPGRPVPAYTDPGRIRQVLDGLLENALRVVPPGSPVVLAVRPAGADPAHGGVLEVRDGGPGFTDDDLAVAFERGALHERYRGCARWAADWGWRWPPGWSAGWAGRSPRGTRRRAVPPSRSNCPVILT